MLPFELPPLTSLGLPSITESFIHKNKGLILVTGAPGSGKSTTLASLVNSINQTYNYHIITIEDPIEYLHRHQKSLVAQREIGEDTDSFSLALQATMREDPDVVMVGEMSDPEVISKVLKAAETGHLVLTSMHTEGAAKTIESIINAFPSGQQSQVKIRLATVLEGILSQQLLPCLDRPGLIAASEVLVMTPAVRNLIREGKYDQIRSLMNPGHSEGMQLLEADLARLFHEGKISLDDAELRAPDPRRLKQFLPKDHLPETASAIASGIATGISSETASEITSEITSEIAIEADPLSIDPMFTDQLTDPQLTGIHS
jgi:twitching motility protein PilT